jgi:two-component system, response regulator YesN
MARRDFTNRDGIDKKISRVREDLRDGALLPLRKALEYLDAHFDQTLTLEMLAGRAKLSVSRLAHRFKEETGTTLIEYLTWVRIGHAQRLLSESDMSCLKIADEVGYNNQSYFSRAFRRVTGITPRQYRHGGKSGKSGKRGKGVRKSK